MNKDQLKAAFAKGARIQAWHLLQGATNSNQGQWDTLTPAEGARPEFGCEAHLYRVHPEDISLIAELGQEVGAVESVWMFRLAGSQEKWAPFFSEQHRLNTMRDPLWEVREFSSPAHTSEARDVQDAARYRKLKGMFRAQFHRSTCDYWVMEGECKTDPRFIGEAADQMTTDAALDAAMRQEGGSDE